jgi:DNA topoisomerase-1
MKSIRSRYKLVEAHLADIRAIIRKRFRASDMRCRRQAASLLVLIETGIRPGNPGYVKNNDTYGLTTLTFAHIKTKSECVFLNYVGKKQVPQKRVVCDRRLTAWMAEAKKRNVKPFSTAPTLRRILGAWGIRIKDIRTWKANAVFKRAWGRSKNVRMSIEDVSQVLGNRPATVRKSYVDTTLVKVAGKTKKPAGRPRAPRK